jgi:hypothetical protein
MGIPARSHESITQILLSPETEAASAARGIYPGNPDPVTYIKSNGILASFHHLPYNLMARDDREM